MLKTTILSSLLIFCSVRTAITDISQVCDPIGDKFKSLKAKKEFDYNVLDRYKEGFFVGKGSFGEVRKSSYGYEGVNEVAIKKIKNEGKILPEFDVLLKFSPMGVGPTFYGCQYNEKEVYIVLTLLYQDLSHESTLMQFKTKKCSEFIARIRDAVESLAIMWSNGYIHNDIKEANMMTNFDFSKFYLIDFGLAQSTQYGLKSQGSPIYMSPNKWVAGYKEASPRDDLYSIGITIGAMEEINGYSALFAYKDANGIARKIPDSCFTNQLESHCQQVLKFNIRNVLTKSNFGNYHRSPARRTEQNINFTTLVALMINYSDYDFTYEQTLRILDRLIAKFESIEKSGKKFYVETRDATYTDPDDQPDKYDFNRKFPRVEKSVENSFAYKLQLATKRANDLAILQGDVHRVNMEALNKEKLAQEQLAQRLKEQEEEANRKLEKERRDREAAELKRKQDKEVWEAEQKRLREIYEKQQAQKALLQKQEQERQKREEEERKLEIQRAKEKELAEMKIKQEQIAQRAEAVIQARKKIEDLRKKAELDNRVKIEFIQLQRKNSEDSHFDSHTYRENPELWKPVVDGNKQENLMKIKGNQMFIPAKPTIMGQRNNMIFGLNANNVNQPDTNTIRPVKKTENQTPMKDSPNTNEVIIPQKTFLKPKDNTNGQNNPNNAYQPNMETIAPIKQTPGSNFGRQIHIGAQGQVRIDYAQNNWNFQNPKPLGLNEILFNKNNQKENQLLNKVLEDESMNKKRRFDQIVQDDHPLDHQGKKQIRQDIKDPFLNKNAFNNQLNMQVQGKHMNLLNQYRLKLVV